MKYIIPIAFAILSISSSAQPIKKVLIIDTLSTPDSTFKVDIKLPITPPNTVEDLERIDSISQHLFALDGYFVKSASAPVNFSSKPQVVLPIEIEDTSVIVDLPLDDSGGVFSLKGAYQLTVDTIRISKFIVFHNCFTDTIKRYMSWYLNNADTSEERKLKLLKYKAYRPIAVVKDCQPVVPAKYEMLINQIAYTISPVTEHRDPAPNFAHGYKKMSRRKERRYEERIANSKPYKYFYWREKTFKYHLFAEADLR